MLISCESPWPGRCAGFRRIARVLAGKASGAINVPRSSCIVLPEPDRFSLLWSRVRHLGSIDGKPIQDGRIWDENVKYAVARLPRRA